MVTYDAPIAARRDAKDTKARILDALGRLLVREGLGAVGVNAVAREAGADKVLIYRYFKNLNGVYEAFAERADFWYSARDLIEAINPLTMSLGEAVSLCLRRHAEEIRRRPIALAVLAAEPAHRTALVAVMEEVRERRALEVARWLGDRFARTPGVDLAAVSLVLSAAINYLAARALRIKVMNGVSISTDRDWERLLAAVDQLVSGVLPRV